MVAMGENWASTEILGQTALNSPRKEQAEDAIPRIVHVRCIDRLLFLFRQRALAVVCRSLRERASHQNGEQETASCESVHKPSFGPDCRSSLNHQSRRFLSYHGQRGTWEPECQWTKRGLVLPNAAAFTDHNFGRHRRLG